MITCAGTGGNPNLGEQTAEESREAIATALREGTGMRLPSAAGGSSAVSGAWGLGGGRRGVSTVVRAGGAGGTIALSLRCSPWVGIQI
jgi:cell division GTPase FtsZ